jgi:hypothetical protein
MALQSRLDKVWLFGGLPVLKSVADLWELEWGRRLSWISDLEYQGFDGRT